MPARRTILAACLAACTGPQPPPAVTARPAPGPAIHVVRRGWHTDLGLPAPALFRAVPTLRPPFGGAAHLLVGFGDRAYLQAEGWAMAEGLAALLGGGPGALLVTGLSVPPESAFPAEDVVAIPADTAEIAGATGFVATAFEPDAAGQPRLLRHGPYAGSLFYGAVAPYSAGYTCNSWTADGLRRAGFPIDPAGLLFTSGVMAAARRFAGER